jgi:hypothetical protein
MYCINVVQDPGAFRDETSHILVVLVTACETVAITVVGIQQRDSFIHHRIY